MDNERMEEIINAFIDYEGAGRSLSELKDILSECIEMTEEEIKHFGF